MGLAAARLEFDTARRFTAQQATSTAPPFSLGAQQADNLRQQRDQNTGKDNATAINPGEFVLVGHMKIGDQMAKPAAMLVSILHHVFARSTSRAN